MPTRSRRQTRQRRTTGWAPEQHNESAQLRKALTRANKRQDHLRRNLDSSAQALAVEAKRQSQIAWADRMAVLGFDMRDEHDALERGELVD